MLSPISPASDDLSGAGLPRFLRAFMPPGSRVERAMPRSRSFIDGECIRKARTLRRVEPIYESLAVALAAIPALRFVNLFPGRLSASNRLSTDGKKNPVVDVGAEGIIGVELLVDSETQVVQVYAITSAEKGCGRQRV